MFASAASAEIGTLLERRRSPSLEGFDERRRSAWTTVTIEWNRFLW